MPVWLVYCRWQNDFFRMTFSGDTVMDTGGMLRRGVVPSQAPALLWGFALCLLAAGGSCLAAETEGLPSGWTTTTPREE